MEQFTRVVGCMPFTAKHGARFMYAEATRAALHGNEPARRWYARRLGLVALANDLMAAGGVGTASLCVNAAVQEHSPAFAVEAAGCALYALGHGASAVAQHWMVHRHNTQAEALAARDTPLVRSVGQEVAATPPRAPAQPSMWERIVTNAGTAITLVPVAHMAIEQLILRQ